MKTNCKTSVRLSRKIKSSNLSSFPPTQCIDKVQSAKKRGGKGEGGFRNYGEREYAAFLAALAIAERRQLGKKRRRRRREGSPLHFSSLSFGERIKGFPDIKIFVTPAVFSQLFRIFFRFLAFFLQRI